jgi:hypothetical protein
LEEFFRSLQAAGDSRPRDKKFKIQMAKGKWKMENHLKFAICRLPFDLLVCP